MNRTIWDSIKIIFGRVLMAVLGVTALLLPITFATRPAQAQTYTVLYLFTGGADGGQPDGRLFVDSAGNIYGTASIGGTFNAGTVFKLDPTGTETVLYTFAGGSDGQFPGGLIGDPAGNLYGITGAGGGFTSCGDSFGCGTVYKVNPQGRETVLYRFTGGADGGNPNVDLVRDPAGNFYDTTYTGGAFGVPGTVFELNKAAKNEAVLYSFKGYPKDGGNPQAGLVRDAAGNLYGTTYGGGGAASGIVFKIDPSGAETILHTFVGTSKDGANPLAPLVLDSAGNLYGTTQLGGAFGLGTVFKLDTTGAITLLHSFTGGADGGQPFGGLLRDPSGNLYGTTPLGGDLTCASPYGCGTVFKLSAHGFVETVLHNFAGGPSDGQGSVSGLTRDAAGNIYGSTLVGGISDFGVVYKITP